MTSREPGAEPIPVTVITGFLGSGKTTLLRLLLDSPELADSAVLINEFGEIGLDHHLIRQIDEDIVMLASGCVCCTIRDDLGRAMRDLLDRRQKGEIPAFRRLIIETTGLADPAPILYTLMTEPVVDKAFRMRTVITTVDAVNGERHLARQPESAKQAAVADRIVITKVDIADAATLAAITARLRRLNPAATILTSPSPRWRPRSLLDGGGYDLANKPSDVRAWLNDEALRAAGDGHDHGARDVNRHDEHIAAFSLIFDEPINWTGFGIWLTMLLHSHGEEVLRVKGLINVAGQPGPVVVHGVQHIIHPPVHLDRWPDADRRSRIVFITRDIAKAAIEASLSAFNRVSATLDDGRDRPGERRATGAGIQIGGRPVRRSGGLAWMK